MSLISGCQRKRVNIKADGVVVPLQSEKKRRREMKLAFSYEGLSEWGKSRFRTLEEMVHAGFSPAEEFWQGFSVELAGRYDLGGVKEIILGGDGASRVKGGGRLFRVDSCRPDRFHLARALKRAPGAGSRAAYRRAKEGDWKATYEILVRALAEATDEKAEKVDETRRYLASNRDGLAEIAQRQGRRSPSRARSRGGEHRQDYRQPVQEEGHEPGDRRRAQHGQGHPDARQRPARALVAR